MHDRIGVMASLKEKGSGFKEMKRYNLKVCQLYSWEPHVWSEELAGRVRADAKSSGIHITAFWAGWTGPATWNMVDGPGTLGLLPAAYRYHRIMELTKAGDFAQKLGVPAIITHLGFIPENPLDSLFRDMVIAVRAIAQELSKRNLEFWFETGQETPLTLLRLIREVGAPNLGINLDPANLILYGKGNPIDALDVFGKYVRNIHAKDALCPTDPSQIGREVKVGEGRVRFPEFVRKLKKIGFKGEFIIEREVSGEQQARDILETTKYLKKLLEAKND
ncbi:MAG: sugar phosphate isomerase/epimerase [Kiritimatiellae bacterium]|nr:sugar phosphate isomerase/epimerase [Kiritimatiellia bacterium]